MSTWFLPESIPKTKNPLGMLRQRAAEYVFYGIATDNSTGAACGRDDGGADAPEDGLKCSSTPFSVNKAAQPVNCVQTTRKK
jgi:hypothetical protein